MGIWGAEKRTRYDDENDDGVFGFFSSTLCIFGEEGRGRTGGVSVWRRSRD
jgi:hypothetical protein